MSRADPSTREFIVLEKRSGEKAVNYEGADAIFQAHSLEELVERLALKTGTPRSPRGNRVAPDGGRPDGE